MPGGRDGEGHPAVTHRVTLLPGDGIGPEVTGAARRVMDAALPGIAWEVHDIGAAAMAATGDPLPDAAVASVLSTGVALKGPLGSAPGPSPHGPLNVALRARLGIFAQMRPVRSWPGLRVPAGIDLVVTREMTEDFAAGLELPAGGAEGGAARRALAVATGVPVTDGTALTIRPVSEAATRRFAEHALTWAEEHGRRRVTVAHKATLLRATDGLFLDVCREVAAGHSGIELTDRLVDALCADLVRDPGAFDVVLAPFLYGDIISDVAAAVSGGLGLAPGVNYGPAVAVFEAAHGTVPRRAGKDEADPLAAVLSGALLLRHLGEATAADRVTAAVAAVLAGSDALTYDLRADRVTGVIGTAALTDLVVDQVVRAGAPVAAPPATVHRP